MIPRLWLPLATRIFHETFKEISVQGTSKRLFPGLVNYVPADAYHCFLNLPAAFLQPGNSLILELCIDLAEENGSIYKIEVTI